MSERERKRERGRERGVRERWREIRGKTVERERVCKHQKTLKPKARGQAWRKRERKRVRIKTAGVMM